MGFEDKAKNKIDEIGGKVKEAIGKITDDVSIENEGKSDQVKSNLKDAAEKVKDAFKEK
ncbi:CsbD family protein [Mycolicibacterium sp.]|uniref:CsbD family protein n=1 Tax=Mycolicibacterium sp. TaxID=2320850 RepID=UPI0028AA9137|nr:CsbD family protein [Mycolicibacterium sp.]